MQELSDLSKEKETSKDTELENVNTEKYVIEKNKKLSESFLWGLQTNYFDKAGANAWINEGVPHYITSNPFIAKAYAHVVFGFMRDMHKNKKVGKGKTVYILELGTGVGRFSFHFLKKFCELMDNSLLKEMKWKYVMTDFTKRNIKYWSEHRIFRPYLERGVLDFAQFDMVKNVSMQLENSQETLSIDNKNPIVTIANYVFDTIPQDVFFIQSGILYESRVSVHSTKPVDNLQDSSILPDIEVLYEHQPTSTNYFEEESLNHLLKYYYGKLADTALLFPSYALKCVKRLEEISDGNFLLLCGDRGYIHEGSLLDKNPPEMSIHGGCFSLDVNFNVMAQYFEQKGGVCLHPTHSHASLLIGAFLSDKEKFEETHLAYQENIKNFTPDDFFLLTSGLQTFYEQFSAGHALAYLRMSGWDAKILLECLPAINKELDQATEALKKELYYALHNIWDNFYPIGEENDVAFHIGSIMFHMKYFKDAITFFEYSIDDYGDDVGTVSNIGLSYYSLMDYDKALAYINRALEINPEHTTSRKLLIRINDELGRK